MEDVPQEQKGKGFYSWYFLIPKAKGGLRSILDLRELNKFVKKLEFHMVSSASIIPSLDPGDWYAALDLKDTFVPIAITPSHRQYLWFVVNSTHYQFTVLPFGVLAAPRIFTKCLAVVAMFLCKQQVQVFPDLHDCLIQGSGREASRFHKSVFRRTDTATERGEIKAVPGSEDRLCRGGTGFDTHHGVPSRSEISSPGLHYLRSQTIPHHHSMELPETSRTHGCVYLHSTACQTQTSTSSAMAGVSVSASPGQSGQDCNPASPGTRLPPVVARPAGSMCKGPLHQPPAIPLSSDGRVRFGMWGVPLGDLKTQGLWSQVDLALHINVRELRAARLACQTFRAHLGERCASVLTDNTTVMFCINKWGCTFLSPVPGSPYAVGLLCRALDTPASVTSLEYRSSWRTVSAGPLTAKSGPFAQTQ
ncbi:serum response factor isoform 1-T1 [Macrochelys suwanniensis]